MDRRTFFEFVGVAGASLAAGCSGAPAERIYSYLTPPDGLVPGVATHYASVCRSCPAGCGLVVRTREGRPVKLEGNPHHPVNRGRLCPRGQAFVQRLYSRYRVQRPLVRRAGQLVPVSWAEALAVVTERLKAVHGVGLLTGLENGSFDDLVAQLRLGYARLEHVTYETFSLASLRAASQLVFGRDEVPEFELDRADYILSLGADFLDAWVSPVKFPRQWSERHAGTGRTLALEYVGPRRNLTATAADLFTLAPAEEIAPLAVAILRRLFLAEGRRLADVDRLAPLITRLPAPHVSADTNAIVTRLLRAKHPLILFGGTEVMGDAACAGHLAVTLANLVTGAIGRSMVYGTEHVQSKAVPTERTLQLLTRVAGGELDALFVYGANPAYTLPGAFDAPGKLAAAKFVVALAWEQDETCEHAHVVLPVHHPLEAWGDYQVARGVVGLMQPVRVPLFDTRHAGDVLIDLWQRAGRPVTQPDFKSIVAARWAQMGVPDLDEALRRGGLFAPAEGEKAPPPLGALDGVGELLQRAARVPARDGLTLIAPLTAQLYDGRSTTQDWLLEIPDSLTQLAWEIPAELSADVASRLGVQTGDRVRLSRDKRSLDATALVNPEMAPGTVALRFGGGRRFMRDQVPSGNVMALFDATLDRSSGELALVQAGLNVTRIDGERRLANVNGEPRTAPRFLCLGMKLADARAGHFPTMTREGEVPVGEDLHAVRLPMPEDDVRAEGTRPERDIYPMPVFPQYRWGMSVDLDKCIGCAACVAACYAENNVAVVGHKQISLGREMAWLRIEKHVFPDEPRPQRIRFLPVMCQHCAQAPCETVCPVFAAYHTRDGLNAQIYNRCIGTRYCMNNCPYKIRRFNWFDWNWDETAKQQLNPDVTVRYRGVMEKCTFCIQRIRDATNRARVSGQPIRDEQIQTACMQTCPTGVYDFGDLHQSDWKVSRLARDKRGYRVLDYRLSTRTSVFYLRRLYGEET